MLISHGSKFGSLYPIYVSNKNSVLLVKKLSIIALWHSQLGHMSKKGIKTLSCLGCLLPSLSFSQFSLCVHCEYGKQTHALHNISFEKERKPFELVH